MLVAGFFQLAIPASQAFFAIAHVGFAHHFVHGVAHRNSFFAHGHLFRRAIQCEARFRLDVIFYLLSSGRPFNPFAK